MTRETSPITCHSPPEFIFYYFRLWLCCARKLKSVELTSGFSLRLENRKETGFSPERREVMSYVKVWIHAVSVSESMVDKVRDYIKNQEEHHKKGTFMEGYDEFIRKFNFRRHG